MFELHVIRQDELVLIKPLEERVTIGGDSKCDIALPGTLEPFHASIEVSGNKLSVRELDGAVFYNGQRIPGTAVLQPKDIFDLGEFRFQISKKTPSSSASLLRTRTATKDARGTAAVDEMPTITFLKPPRKAFCQLNIVVGRGSDCDLMILDNSESRLNVSRRHVEIYVKNGLYYARDLQSKNGTNLFGFNIDGRPLPRRGTLLLGRYELPYEIESPASLAQEEEGILIPSLNPHLAPKRMLGKSPAMKVLREKLDRALATEQIVLILGENGTGKDLCARYLHFYHEKRRDGPFVPVNCASIPKQLVESFLFGHMKGAFTGAINNSQGVFEQAHGGTLFLDEIGELKAEVQAQLLRVLEDGMVTPVGSTKAIPVNARIIFATNRDVDTERQLGGFRDDLYYRCKSIIRVPSLRERRDDIKLLADVFMRNSGRPLDISPSAMEALFRYPWPGNVRELSVTIERSILNATFRGSTVITEEDLELEDDIRVYAGRAYQSDPEAMKEQIIHLLKEYKGNVSQVAEVLKVERKTLYRRMQSFQIDPTLFRV